MIARSWRGTVPAGKGREYLAVVIAAYLIPLVMWMVGAASVFELASWLALPWFVPLARDISRLEGRPLNRVLGKTGQLELIYGLFLSLGFILQVIFA